MKPAQKQYFYWGLLVAAYILLTIFVPASKQVLHDYHLSLWQYRILSFSVILPLLFIWFAALYGYIQLRAYAKSIEDSREGLGFSLIARGCLVLAWGLPIPALINRILTGFANAHPGFHSAQIIIANYINLLVPLIAFSLISTGSWALLRETKLRMSLTGAKKIVLVFVILGVAFCYFIFKRLDLHSLASSHNPYYLPVWLMVLTIIIPYLYAWFVGLLAAYEISLLARFIKGVLYRHALQLFAAGLVAIIAASISFQYITTVIPRSGRLSLSYLLLLVYIAEIIYGVGFILLARGANKLKRIEEV